MVIHRDAFTSYRPLDNTFITVADGATKLPVEGIGTAVLRLGANTVRLKDVLHVPSLQISLLSVRRHRRRGQGCSMIADSSGCFLTFPTFTTPIDDTHDFLVPCTSSLPTSSFDYDDFESFSYTAGTASHIARLSFKARNVTVADPPSSPLSVFDPDDFDPDDPSYFSSDPPPVPPYEQPETASTLWRRQP